MRQMSRQPSPALLSRAGPGADGSALDPKDWQAMLRHVRRQHPSLVRVWFDLLRPRQLSNGMIQVLTDTLPQLAFCQSQCQQPFTAAAQAVTGRLVAVSFHCEKVKQGVTGGVFGEADSPLPLHPDYVFENFVIGPCNRLSHAASVAVADHPGRAYNPLFIHGDVGLGKTHLLQATCQTVLERDPDARILYLSCESFVNQYINAVETTEWNEFRLRFRQVDILVIDDIHFLAKRERTQEEFFHTFNTLYQQNKQIILSADCTPSEIPELEERLVSRFNWGLVARIDKPSYETRMAIVRKKARLRGLSLPDDVVCYIAERVDSNTRELEGAMTKVQGMASLRADAGGTIDAGPPMLPIDLALTRDALGDLATVEEKRVTIQGILDVVTDYFGIRLADLQGKRRHKSVVFPRQICMYLMRQHTRYSLEEVGGYFGGRDHTTVLHAVRTIESAIRERPDVQRQVQQIESQLLK